MELYSLLLLLAEIFLNQRNSAILSTTLARKSSFVFKLNCLFYMKIKCIFEQILFQQTKIRKNITVSSLPVKVDISTHFLSVAKISPLFKQKPHFSLLLKRHFLLAIV